MRKGFLVFYVGSCTRKGPLHLFGEEPSDVARDFWNNYINSSVESHVDDRLYVIPQNEVTRFSVKGLVTLERDNAAHDS